MIGVTIGIGDGWRECSLWALRRMEQMTGLECFCISHFSREHGVHPSWIKHTITSFDEGAVFSVGRGFEEHDEFLYFDADIICLKPWNPKEIFEKNGRKLCAVHDNNPMMANAVLAEEHAIGIPHGTYLNAGLMIFGREHAPVFEATWARRPQWHSWIDQSAWNRALYDLNMPVAVLPREFNEMGAVGMSTINAHIHSLNGDWRKLEALQGFYTNQEVACKHPSASAAPRK